MRRLLSDRGPSCVDQPDLLWLWHPGAERLVCSLAFVSRMRNEPASRPQRRKKYRTGRAGPSGSRGVGCGEEPSIPSGSVKIAAYSTVPCWFATVGCDEHEVLARCSRSVLAGRE